MNATFIFTTYHDVSAIGETLTLRKITDEKYIMKLFFDNYERKDINANDSNLRKLFEYFDYHICLRREKTALKVLLKRY